MLVEASVSEAEVHRVRTGQPAVVRLEAFPSLRLAGSVARVGTLSSSSSDRPIDDKRFELIVELDATSADLRPEMTARADIVVGTRENVLVVPVNAVYEQQGSFVVHVVKSRGAETRLVGLGASNDQWVEVVAGVREGERVMLNALR
jgi:multidrug efflux pump subunit AcrA (membrane-fusion protein)